VTQVSFIYRTEPTNKKWKKKKKRKIEMDRSIGKQSGESVKSVLEKKKEATVGRICGEENNVLSLE